MSFSLLLLAFAMESLTLQRAMEMVDAQNPDVVLAKLSVNEAAAAARMEKSALLPQLNVQAGASYQTSSLGAIGLQGPSFPLRIGPYRVLDGRPRLEQAVVDLPQWSAWKAAKLKAEAAGKEVRVRREAAKLAVAELYFDALEAESRARAAESRLKQAETLRKQTEDAWTAGTANRLDVARASQRVEAERTSLLVAQRDRKTLATQLLRAIGVAQEEVALAQVVATEEVAAGLRAEMEALEAQGRVLAEELKKAERARFPKVSAFGDYGALGSSFTSGVSTYAVGVSITLPIWTSGRIESGIQGAKVRIEKWREEKRKLELQISQEVAQAVAEREAAKQVNESARRAVEASREALEMAQLRYGAGMTTNLDLVTAQSELAASEETEIQARYDRLRAEVRLARARGDVAAALVR